MIDYEFVPLSLQGLDALETELLVLPFFSDERPLAGATGLVDWRLCGALSRKILSGYIDGREGETALLVSPAKLGAKGLLLVGLGPSGSFDADVATRSCALIANVLTESRVSTAAMVLPGRSQSHVPALDTMQIWLSAELDESRLEEVTIIERGEGRRALESVLDGLRRQAESPIT